MISRKASHVCVFLSTPSGWRATFAFLLRILSTSEFLSTPSGWRATRRRRNEPHRRAYFYPRPPGGGRRENMQMCLRPRQYFYPRPPGGGRLSFANFTQAGTDYFYPRPPGGGRHGRAERSHDGDKISIHALRVEGDRFPLRLAYTSFYFYPRPPGGGRHQESTGELTLELFLSTPSGWRATSLAFVFLCRYTYFYPRPPGGGRPWAGNSAALHQKHFYPRPPGGGRPQQPAINIVNTNVFLSTPSGWRATFISWRPVTPSPIFLSTPSGWRATSLTPLITLMTPEISIHALRVEGDFVVFEQLFGANRYFYPRPPGGGRLSVTAISLILSDFYPRPPGGGRQTLADLFSFSQNFYPRPPGGGRPKPTCSLPLRYAFLSTPSGWRATCFATDAGRRHRISIHALRVEGDREAAALEKLRLISIHALRVEGDSKNGQNFRLFLRKRGKNLPF